MNETKLNRKRLLNALLDYAEKSGNFNPHFYKKEMMNRLSVTEGEFNVIQKNLGDKYCYYVDPHGDDKRYAIKVDECWALQERYDQESISEKRHQQLVRLAILVAILGAILGAALSFWFLK